MTFHLPAQVIFFTLHSHFNPIVDSQHTRPHHGLKVTVVRTAGYRWVANTQSGSLKHYLHDLLLGYITQLKHILSHK